MIEIWTVDSRVHIRLAFRVEKALIKMKASHCPVRAKARSYCDQKLAHTKVRRSEQ